MEYKIKDIIFSKMPLIDDKLIVDTISLEEILSVWESSINEDREIITCRPIVKRSYDDAKVLFSSLLDSDTTFILGIYIYLKDDKRQLVGRVTFSDYNCRNQSMEIGYTTISQFRKKGYMKRALSKIFYTLFSEAAINKIYAQTGEFNKPSIRLLESLHFHCDGCLRQHHQWKGILYDDFIYSLTREDYKTLFLENN